MTDKIELSLTENNGKLERTIGFFGGTGIVVGSIIGSGIFLSPAGVLENAGNIGTYLIIWCVSGVISLFGGLCFAELGTTIPKSGAEYNYILEGIGPLFAFLFLWASVFIIKPAAVAIISLTSALYASKAIMYGYVVPDLLIKLIAAQIIILITALNIFSVRWALRINNFLNWIKIIAILVVVGIGIYGFVIGGGRNFQDSFDSGSLSAGKIGISLYLGLWAYDGWNNLNYAAEEMKNPNKNLPLSIGVGMIIVTIAYVLINISYVAALGAEKILASEAVALTIGSEYIRAVPWIMSIFVSLSSCGATISTIFGNARLLFVAGREGHLPQILSCIHVDYKTPVPSLILTAAISLLLLIPPASQIDRLISFFSFATWFFFGLCFYIIIYFRFKRKDLLKPYQVNIVIPFIMLLVSVFLIILPVLEDYISAIVAGSIIISGIPVYYLFIKFNDKLPQVFVKGYNSLSYYLMEVYNLTPATKEEDLC